MAVLEIEGDSAQRMIYAGQAGCPLSGEWIKSVLCSYREQCELLTIQVKAENDRDAQWFTEYAASIGEIPNCRNGKPFLTRMFGRTIQFQPAV